jgi:H2-forming N5,N10-methylenetetrahydromethanopterin dehydrogenase-like enzyme
MTDEELRQIVQSNARAIQGMLDAMAGERLEREARNQRLDETISRLDESIARLTNLNEGVVNLLSSLDEDRPTILRKLTTIENKADRILDKVDGEGA